MFLFLGVYGIFIIINYVYIKNLLGLIEIFIYNLNIFLEFKLLNEKMIREDI